MVTNAQALIIREVCKIQNQSLEEVFMGVSIGAEREEILENFGLTRSDFDKAILKSKKHFERVHEEPDKLDELDYNNLIVFLFILSKVRETYQDEFPNAIKNLGLRVIKLMDIKEYQNLS